MWKENLYQPVEVLIRNHEIFPIAEHQHSFFEMVYVYEGTGQFYVKESDCKVEEVTYHTHSLFLIPPETTHRFMIDTHSEYVFIRFVLHYVEDYIGKYMAEIFRDPSRSAEISLNESDKKMTSLLFDFIKREEDSRQMGTNYLQQQWLNSILVLVARNIVHETKDNRLSAKYLTINETNPAVYMLQYIQQHIHQPELLRAENLSKTFHLSPDYIGVYFKRNYQETLQQYIGRNRLKMVENLLLNSSMTVKEIAYKMGYTDSCYLVKSFQKVYGMSPLKYRQEHSHSQNLK
ncbi:helix-turn-helix domain-containing protein [Parabacteroides distasonis]|uniref:helix-turn-helix domain-containing protein n=1 Tax=Parabacteroides distasonis TaxID=823 RepID=UPI00189B525B|nr:helix-turn-helix domain-containing protein [Parabacteroides distasonis]MDB8997677.1 helix-turn-helix domain-containing protein [Parabacteroides distasonis]MDB9070091.1 helix-turn-helix domain-containing protein [Parabacteroides distasonis]